MKVIILSVRAKHGADIVKLLKPLELRKRVPFGYKGLVYIYITLAAPYLGRSENYGWQHKERFSYELFNIPHFGDLKLNNGTGDLNGKVVARFWFDEYETIEWWGNQYLCLSDKSGENETLGEYTKKQFKKLCITQAEAEKYLNYQRGYLWHIKNLEVFDEPMELGDFWVVKTKSTPAGKSMNIYSKLTKAPQSWQYAYLKEGKV